MIDDLNLATFAKIDGIKSQIDSILVDFYMIIDTEDQVEVDLYEEYGRIMQDSMSTLKALLARRASTLHKTLST